MRKLVLINKKKNLKLKKKTILLKGIKMSKSDGLKMFCWIGLMEKG